jgi:hypothetical protein
LDSTNPAPHNNDPADQPGELGRIVHLLRRLRLMLSTMSAQIGASALIGMSLFILITPLQTFFMKVGSSLQISHRLLMAADTVCTMQTSFKVRQNSMVSIDVVEA